MKVALGYIARNQPEWLSETLPKVANSFSGVVAVDFSDSDESEAQFKKIGATVVRTKWTGNYSTARNLCISTAEACQFDAMMMLDCDECMFDYDIKAVLELWNKKSGVAIPRYNLCGIERRRWRPDLYPDMQSRLFPLRNGWKYINALHETLSNDNQQALTTECRLVHIYHYGYCQDPKKVWLRHENYRRLKIGEPELHEVPDGVEIEDAITINAIPFRPPHPLL